MFRLTKVQNLSIFPWGMGFLQIKSLHLPFDPSYNMLVLPWLVHMWESTTTRTLIIYLSCCVMDQEEEKKGPRRPYNHNHFSCQTSISSAYCSFTRLSQLGNIILISKRGTTVQLHKSVPTQPNTQYTLL